VKPKIGVTGPDLGGWPAWTATRFAIWRAGGRAVRITPSDPKSLSEVSGLIIGGGADVDPKLYNEDCVNLDVRKQIRRETRKRWRRKQAFALIGYCPHEGFEPSLRGQLRAFFSLTRYRVGVFVDVILLVALWFVRHLMSVPWETAVQGHKNRDTLEVPLVREAIAQGLPVLGICRGMQLINVCLGGSLYQEISVFYEETPILKTLLPRKRIEIAPRLRQIFRHQKLHVNSLHYQSVKILGKGLVAVAQESNGIIQAIENSGSSYIVGVQWHPEYLAIEKPIQQRLFRSLVQAAQAAMNDPNKTASDAVTPPATDGDTIAQIASSQRVDMRQPMAAQ
jgi:putative glutamine amidotransferase